MQLEFKVYDKVNKIMYDDNAFLLTQNGDLFTFDTVKGFIGVNMNEHVVLFYTGVKDKNNVKIFEGDILTSKDYPYQDYGAYKYHGVIEWDVSAFYITRHSVDINEKGHLDLSSDLIVNEDLHEFEVIGNIYENINLFEGDK